MLDLIAGTKKNKMGFLWFGDIKEAKRKQEDLKAELEKQKKIQENLKLGVGPHQNIFWFGTIFCRTTELYHPIIGSRCV